MLIEQGKDDLVHFIDIEPLVEAIADEVTSVKPHADAKAALGAPCRATPRTLVCPHKHASAHVHHTCAPPSLTETPVHRDVEGDGVQARSDQQHHVSVRVQPAARGRPAARSVRRSPRLVRGDRAQRAIGHARCMLPDAPSRDTRGSCVLRAACCVLRAACCALATIQ